MVELSDGETWEGHPWEMSNLARPSSDVQQRLCTLHQTVRLTQTRAVKRRCP